jgi:hypothetical protein
MSLPAEHFSDPDAQRLYHRTIRRHEDSVRADFERWWHALEPPVTDPREAAWLAWKYQDDQAL